MIREASSDDYKSISEILGAEGMLEPIGRKRLLDSLNPNLHKSERWFVAENRENVLGTAYCFWGSFYGYIGNVAVKSEYRRKKVGSQLVETTIDFLRDQKVAVVGLFVRKGDEETNLEFFENLKFKYHETYLMDIKLKE